MSNAEASGVFDKVFGQCGIQEEEVYYAPMAGIDKRKAMGQAWVQKAPSVGHSTGGSVTALGLMP